LILLFVLHETIFIFSIILNVSGNGFRARIVILESEMEALRGANHKLTTQLTSTIEAKESAENVIRTMEFEKSELQIKYEELEKHNRELTEQVN